MSGGHEARRPTRAEGRGPHQSRVWFSSGTSDSSHFDEGGTLSPLIPPGRNRRCRGDRRAERPHFPDVAEKTLLTGCAARLCFTAMTLRRRKFLAGLGAAGVSALTPGFWSRGAALANAQGSATAARPFRVDTHAHFSIPRLYDL